MTAGTVPQNVAIWYRGASYELGRGQGFYGIWAAGGPRTQPIEWWPETPEGWHGAWSRFTSIQPPGSIVRLSQSAASAESASTPDAPAGRRGIIAASVLAAGVVVGVIGLFPDYLGGASLAAQPPNLIPHVVYLAAWAASAALILLGGARLRTGALLGIGTSIVTFGLFLADAGTVIAAGAHVLRAGLVLGLIGWLLCAAGCALAFRPRPAMATIRLHGRRAGYAAALTLAAIGAAAAFAPSWDSYTLHAAVSGASQTVTEGNAFSNPAPVIAGDVIVMVAIVAVVVAAGLWRPLQQGAALLAGAVIVMVAQAISALVLVGETASPLQFDISPVRAAELGLTISSGVTPAFWIYCAFVAALIALGGARLLMAGDAGASRTAAVTPG